MEQALRRLAGVADVSSDYRTGLMQVKWRPAVPFDLARLKTALLTWRGGVRFGSAAIVATGTVVPLGTGAERREGVALRVAETGQRFGLRARRGEGGHGGPPLPAPGARVRLTGEVELPRRGEEGCDLVVTVRSCTECAP
jgi:hypothetical protein